MNQKIKIFGAIVAFIVLISMLLPFISNRKEDKLIEETAKRVAIEEQLRSLEKDLIKIQQQRDEAVDQYNITSALYKEQKKHPQIIIKNYEVNRENINKLNPTESFQLFTNNQSDYNCNKQRYSLERFKRIN